MTCAKTVRAEMTCRVCNIKRLYYNGIMERERWLVSRKGEDDLEEEGKCSADEGNAAKIVLSIVIARVGQRAVAPKGYL